MGVSGDITAGRLGHGSGRSGRLLRSLRGLLSLLADLGGLVLGGAGLSFSLLLRLLRGTQLRLEVSADLLLHLATDGSLVDLRGIIGTLHRRCSNCVRAAFLKTGTQLVVLILQLCKRVLDEVEELVDLVLVVASLANRRLAESDIVHVSWCQRHLRSLR